MLNECDVRLNQSGLDLVVLLTGTRIEGAYVLECALDCFDGPGNGARDFLMLFVLQGAKVLVHNCNRVGKHLGGPVSVLAELRLMITELVKQALAQIAAGDARRVELPHNFDGFMELLMIEANRERRFRSIR